MEDHSIDWSFYGGIGFGARRFDDGSWLIVLPFVIIGAFKKEEYGNRGK